MTGVPFSDGRSRWSIDSDWLPEPVAYALHREDYITGHFEPWCARLTEAPVYAIRFSDGRVFSVRDGWAAGGDD